MMGYFAIKLGTTELSGCSERETSTPSIMCKGKAQYTTSGSQSPFSDRLSPPGPREPAQCVDEAVDLR